MHAINRNTRVLGIVCYEIFENLHRSYWESIQKGVIYIKWEIIYKIGASTDVHGLHTFVMRDPEWCSAAVFKLSRIV